VPHPAAVHHDVSEYKTLSGANEQYHEGGPHARQRRRRAPAGRCGWLAGWLAERARQVNGECIAKARTLDHEHNRQADGTRYPGVREQVQDHLVGPVLAALPACLRAGGPGARCWRGGG